jgi:hypothetical protein
VNRAHCARHAHETATLVFQHDLVACLAGRHLHDFDGLAIEHESRADPDPYSGRAHLALRST